LSGRRGLRLLLAGALAGGALVGLAAIGRLRSKGEVAGEEVEITFEDGTTYLPDPGSPESRELAGMADRVLEVGV